MKYSSYKSSCQASQHGVGAERREIIRLRLGLSASAQLCRCAVARGLVASSAIINNMDWLLRLAHNKDIPQLEELIPLSVRTLQESYYSPAQMEAALGPVFGVDRQLITDGTYFVVESEKQIIGCGGWSRRESLFGSDSGTQPDDRKLDPKRDAAQIRAFFVHPAWARRGIGREILFACETAIREAGFHHAELVATLSGEPLYAAFGFVVLQRYEVMLPNQLGLPVVRMSKRLS